MIVGHTPLMASPPRYYYAPRYEDDPVGSFDVSAPWTYCEPQTGIISDREATIWSVEIYTEHIGKGHGVRMMYDAIDLCKNLGATSIWLNVEANNEVAIHVYEKVGFERVLTKFKRHSHLSGVGHEKKEIAWHEHMERVNWDHFDDEYEKSKEQYHEETKDLWRHKVWYDARPDAYEMCLLIK